MSAKNVSTMYSEMFIRTRQFQITQELYELSLTKHSDYHIRELLEEYSRLEVALERFAEK